MGCVGLVVSGVKSEGGEGGWLGGMKGVRGTGNNLVRSQRKDWRLNKLGSMQETRCPDTKPCSPQALIHPQHAMRKAHAHCHNSNALCAHTPINFALLHAT